VEINGLRANTGLPFVNRKNFGEGQDFEEIENGLEGEIYSRMEIFKEKLWKTSCR
jgi:hypothetical protein